MSYLSTSRQLGESLTTNLAWKSGNLLMLIGLKLINDIVSNKELNNSMHLCRCKNPMIKGSLNDTMSYASRCLVFLIYGLS
jgi:hypothetical protein